MWVDAPVRLELDTAADTSDLFRRKLNQSRVLPIELSGLCDPTAPNPTFSDALSRNLCASEWDSSSELSLGKETRVITCVGTSRGVASLLTSSVSFGPKHSEMISNQ